MKQTVKEFCGFVLTGAFNTILSIAVFLIVQRYLHYWMAYTLAYLIGIATSYLLNAMFVFRTGANVESIVKFPFVYLAQYLYGSAALVVFIEIFGLPNSIAMLLVIIMSAVLTFALIKRIFKLPPRTRQSMRPKRFFSWIRS